MSQKISSFTILVRDMRKAQKDYFASHAPSDLNRAKALEKQVDAKLKEIFACLQSQGSLL